MGKWSHLRKKLPKQPSDPDRKEIIDELKKQFVGKTDEELLREFATRRELMMELAKQGDDVAKESEAITQLILDRWETTGVEKMELEGLGTFSISDDIYPTIKNKEDLFIWLRANQFGDLIKEQVNHQSLASLVKERLEKGDKLPDMVDVFFKQGLRFRAK